MTDAETLALHLTQLLVTRDFTGAHALLARDLRAQISATDLEREFDRMTERATGDAFELEVSATLDDWPAKQPGDVAWVYVSIFDEHMAEAVAVVVTNEHDALRVRTLEWGRP
jgi:hypothetical protein